MKIGLPTETKIGERRIALTPAVVATLVASGHQVRVQQGAGIGAGFSDAAYEAAGVELVDSAQQAFLADLVVKVKEVQPAEWRLLQPNGMLFSFMNLATGRELAATLLSQRTTALAFDTVEDRNGQLPILAPMSTIAGQLAIPIAAHSLLAPNGGKGVAIKDARVVIIGAGSVGTAAAQVAMSLGADVTVLSHPSPRMARLAHRLGLNARTVAVSPASITHAVEGADVVIGAINIRGAAAEKLLSRKHLRSMGEGAVLIEVCIDGGGISETARATSLAHPTYVDEGVVHYCVPNMPAAVPRSASMALSAALEPYVQRLADYGLQTALREDPGFASGLQLFAGQVTHKTLAATLGRPWIDPEALLFAC